MRRAEQFCPTAWLFTVSLWAVLTFLLLCLITTTGCRPGQIGWGRPAPPWGWPAKLPGDEELEPRR